VLSWSRHWRIALSLVIGLFWILGAFLLIGPLEARIANFWIIVTALFALFLVYGLLAPDHKTAPLFLALLVIAGAALHARYGVDICQGSRTCEATGQTTTGLLILGAGLLVLPTFLGALVHARLRRNMMRDDDEPHSPNARRSA
jgi:hypothetical protein